MIFEQIDVGGDRNFAYLLGDAETGHAAVVDPSYRPELVLDRASAQDLTVVYLLNTHSHYDHSNGNSIILARTGAEFLTGDSGSIKDGEVRSLGSIEITFILTPGHTTDSICVLAKQSAMPGKLLTGDTLFVGKVGGTGYGADARAQYDSLFRKLLALPDDTEVWPGHDYGVTPSSTISHERRTNPFLLRETFEQFVDLKRNWIQYKREHGIA